MATFKAEVYAHHRRADGTYNVKIRVTHKRKKRYISTPWYVSKSEVTKSMRIKSQKILDMAEDMIRRFRAICNDNGAILDRLDVSQVVELLHQESSGGFRLDMVQYTRDYIASLRGSGHPGTARAYEIALNSLTRFAGRERIDVSEIRVEFLRRWMEWIGSQPPRKGMKKCNRAQGLYIASIRAMFNRAKREFNDEDSGLINIAHSPFSRIDVPKAVPPRKRAISPGKIAMIAALPDEHSNHPGTNRVNLARDVFLLSFMLVGMNAIDLYNVTSMSPDGRITYQRTKTRNRRDDRAEISIRVEPEAIPLIERYRDQRGARLFDFHRRYASMDSFSAALNHGLKKIGAAIGEADLEFYAARHSWATIAANEAGVDKYTVHEALNHVDPNLKVTNYYIRRDWSAIDRANRKVLDLVFHGGAE